MADRGDVLQASRIRAGRVDGPGAQAEERVLGALGLGLTATGSVGAAVATQEAVQSAASSAGTGAVALGKPAATAALPAAAQAAAGAAAHGSVTGLAVVAKWFVVGAVGGSAAIGAGSVGHDLLTQRQSAVPHATSSVRGTLDAPAPRQPAPTGVAGPPIVEAAAIPATRRPPAVAPVAPASSASGTSMEASTLRAEVAVLAEVRDALASGNGGRAGERHDAHERTFPRGKLAPEAAMLRLEVLLVMGRREEARRGARGLLEANSKGAWRQRRKEIAAEDARDDSGINATESGHGPR